MDVRDVRTQIFWRPRPQILRPRLRPQESVNKPPRPRPRPRPHMSVNGMRGTGIKYSSTDRCWSGAAWQIVLNTLLVK